MGDTVLYERQNRIGYITLNRPEVLNAINEEWIQDLFAAATVARADREARVVVIRGAGRAFCAGADLKAPHVRREPEAYRAEHMEPEQDAARLFRRMGKPVLAQVHGYAEKPARRQLIRTAEKVAGSLADTDIPGWEASESAVEWVRALRRADDLRLVAEPKEE